MYWQAIFGEFSTSDVKCFNSKQVEIATGRYKSLTASQYAVIHFINGLASCNNSHSEL